MKEMLPRTKEDLSKWSHIRIGNVSEEFYLPQNTDELSKSLAHVLDKGLTPFFLGAGSNVLFGNTEGIAVISDKLLPHIWNYENELITVTANYNITQLIMELTRINRGGLEFLAGIPANIGGITWMNAGAYGHTIGEFIQSVKLINMDGELITIPKEEISFKYRKTNLEGFILEIVLDLPVIQGKEIVAAARRYTLDRKTKQPLQYPNLGSIFKNPQNDYAGRILEECGFKGKSKGNMEFSEMHANFLINKGNGRFNDAVSLINEAKDTVKKETGIQLETEILVVGS